MGIFTQRIFLRLMLALAGVWGCVVGEVRGQVTLPHFDPIDYAVGQGLQTQTNWTSLFSGDDLLISSGNLSYTGLPLSTGNKVTFNGTGIDAAKLFTQQTSGTIYYSFLLNITSLGSLNATGGYFTGFNEMTGTIYGCTVWTRLNGLGYDIGINPRSTAVNTAWVSGVQSVNNTILVVVSYQIVSGTTNDVVKIWINPTPGGAEPSASATATNTLLDLANVNRILIRQDAPTATPSIEMDELRIGTTWASVTPVAGPTLIVSPATLSGYTYAVGSGPSTSQSYSLSGSNLSPVAGNINISGSANYEVSTDNSTFGSTASIAYTGGSIISSNVYVRLKSGLSVGNYNSELIKSSGGGASDVNVACNGFVYNQLNWANLQWPSTGTINLGGGYGVYAQVYEPGVTNAAGQGAGISCWIGYSTSNSNPSGAGWTWIPANYNTDVFDNDEYWVDIGLSIPATGTYYLASRFQQATAPFVYGGCSEGGGGFWDGTNNVSGNLTVNPPPQIDWANLQFPSSGTISQGGNFNVYGQVYEAGLTAGAGQGTGISCWIGYSTSNTNPSTWTTWIPATYNTFVTGNNDEYFANIGSAILSPGTYYYASRFKMGLADYVYGGFDGGFWNGTTNVSGVLTVNPITQVVISQVYGGGGNSGSIYKNDFIELFNRGTTCVSLNGWSIQYTSATNPAWPYSTLLTNVTLAPGQYYLIQEAAGGGGTANLPTPDATGSILMSNSDGKVALVNNTTALTGTCPTGSNIVDFVGYGLANCSEGGTPTAALTNTTAAIRKSNGCIDTDQNAADFDIAAPTLPRNTASPFNICSAIVTITASGPTTFCQGGSVALTASTGTGYVYAWSTGATTQAITAIAAGSYTVTVTNAIGCSSASSATVVTVNALPVAVITAGGPTTFCQGGSVVLTSSAASSYIWSNGATSQAITAIAAGSYTVMVTDVNGCTATSAPLVVAVNPAPIPTISHDDPTTICEGDSAVLQSSEAQHYLWNTGETIQSIPVTSSGSYAVTVTYENGCTATSLPEVVTVLEAPKPIITANGSTTFCQGGSVNLTSSVPSGNHWSTGETTQTITVNASGSYTVKVTYPNGCERTSSATVVTVNALPTAIINPNTLQTICPGTSVVLTASGGTGYVWSNTATTAAITVSSTGIYTVTVTDANGCTDTESASVTVADNELPTFSPPAAQSFCVENITVALFSLPTMDIDPGRPEYFLFKPNDNRLNLNTTTFSDNCPMGCEVQIRWRLNFAGGTFLPSATGFNIGQPSAISSAIQLPGSASANVAHSITYWIVDCNSNVSLPQTVAITIKPRPHINKN